jgi:hypothetical protein
MKLTSAERIGRSQLISGVRQTAEMSTRLTAFITAAHQGGWVRADAIRRIPGGVELTLVLLKGQRGGVVGSSQVRCRGIRELHVTDLNGGGIRIYDSTHPVARQYSARRVRLKWRPAGRSTEALSVLLTAHMSLVDDWIPFDRYTSPSPAGASVVTWRGPEFLMRAYARSLQHLGLRAEVLLLRQQSKWLRLRCLHFGNSFIVAASFEVGSGAT